MLAPMAFSRREQSLGQSIGALIAQHLWAKILLGMVLGTLTGLALSPGGLALLENDTVLTAAEWIALPGVIFLEMLKMVVIPLIICSIALGILTSGSPHQLKRMGAFIVPYFIITSFVAVGIGLAITLIIQPGHTVGTGIDTMVAAMSADGGIKTFDDLTVPQRIVNLIPSNFVEAAMQTDMLKVVIGAIFLGVAALTIPREIAKPFEDLCLFGQVAAMKIISWTMALAPYAVFGLMVDAMVRLGFDILTAIGWYMGCVLLGLVIILGLYLFGAAVFGHRPPFEFLRAIRDVQLLAFSTSSSAAVMPLSIRAAEENLGVSEDISRFVIPVGTTINMDGTGLYQAVAAIFLCQIFKVDLSFTEMILLLCTTVGASIGTPATPGVGIAVLATILSGIGVPPAGIGIIFGVDRILDMCRTTINVTGDLTAVVIMDKWMKGKLA
ncbi:dicarboxylate/amino acid:cation symporter [Nitrosomonas sp.]|uniref:dicarboxylate/amino acid:cation symporter n=2 Tax=Nitrosomonas sp. TaxID=42353 RepID=UPI0037CC3C97